MKLRHLALIAACAVLLNASATDIVSTNAYTWRGDSIIQGSYSATAPDENTIVSTYSAQPGYKFPIDKVWKLKNDISSYPRLITPNTLHRAIYNMGLDEMVNAVEPDTTLRTGREWAGVWTRDVSYSILLSMAYMQPEASKISLMKKVNPNGVIIQDTGSGGAWPVSSDREIWAVAAFEVYKVTGDKQWLQYIYPIIKRSLDDDQLTVMSSNNLVRGETSFIDWREQSYPRWMQTVDIYRSEALGTSVVHAQAHRVLAEAARLCGDKKTAQQADSRADAITKAINDELWMPAKGYYAMYRYGRNFLITNPRAETLGESLAILYNVASPERAREITENNPTTPFGTAIFYPQIADMPPYHNNALWPWVGAYWALANAQVKNEEGTLEAIGAVFRPAALFATNKENFVLDNGDIATELNSSNMLWCLAGNIAITHKILFGIHFDVDGLAFKPFVPEALAADRILTGFPYRNATLDITVKGFGANIKSFKLNGKEHPHKIPTSIKGHNKIEIVMDNAPIPALKVNRCANAKAPWTPQTWIADGTLYWTPLEYITGYKVLRDGKEIALTRQTSFNLNNIPGEYQVTGISADGVESFASEPRSNRRRIVIQFDNERRQIESAEACNLAPVNGYTGVGFAEIDSKTDPVSITFDAPQAGTYAIVLRYANGNGPVNTENKCAIRTVSVDGKRLGVSIMPHRGVGNWNDWGTSNAIPAELSAGRHTITIDFRPENTNMNIATNHALLDCVIIERL